MKRVATRQSRDSRVVREDDTADQMPGIGAVDPRRFQDVLRYFQQPGVQQHAVSGTVAVHAAWSGRHLSRRAEQCSFPAVRAIRAGCFVA